MRGLEKAYNTIMKDVERYYSEEEKVKRAKEKLTKGVLNSKRIRYGLKTQKNVELRCECSPDNVYCKFNLTVPIIRFTSMDYVSLSNKDVSFEKLCELISRHKELCKNNIIETFGNLRVGFYQDIELGVYVTGLVEDKIVFIFRVIPQLCTYADSGSLKCEGLEVYIDLDKEVIILCFRDRELMVRLEDYSIVG